MFRSVMTVTDEIRLGLCLSRNQYWVVGVTWENKEILESNMKSHQCATGNYFYFHVFLFGSI